MHNMLDGCSIHAFCLSVSHPTPTQHWYWPCLPFFPIFLPFLTLWHSPYCSVFPTLTRSAVSGPLWGEGRGGGAAFKTSSSLMQFGDTLSPMVNLSLCWMPGGVLGANQWPLLSLTLGEWEKNGRERKTEGEEQREYGPDKGRETNPSHSAEPGEDGANCQHLSLVKCSLTDNVTLITESPDSDVLSSV